MISDRATTAAGELRAIPPTVTLPPTLEAARQELASLRERHDSAWERRERLARDLVAADEADKLAFARALREDVAPPKARKAVAVQAKLAAADAEVEGLQTAVEEASADALEALEQYASSDDLDGMRAERDEARQEYRELVAALPLARTRATELDAVVRWFEDIATGNDLRFRNLIPPVPLRSASGDSLPFATVHDALVRDFQPLPRRPVLNFGQLVS
jgi:hypothetical protein